MRFFHHIYIERLTFFCLGHRAHTRTYIRTHETQFSLRSAHIKNIGGITNKFLVCFFFFIPKKACQPFTPVKYMYYQSRNSLPPFASALVAFFLFLFALHSFKSHYIYDKSENNKGVFFSTAGQRCSSLASACDGTRRYTSFQRRSSPTLPRKFSFTCTTYKYTYIEKTMQRCVYFVYSVGCLIHCSAFCYPFTYRKTEVENVSANVRCHVFFLLFLFVRNNRCFPILLEVSSPAS